MRAPKKKSSASPADLAIPGVEVGQLEKLLDFMAVHGLEEFEYEHGGFHIRLRKAASGLATSASAPVPRAAATAAYVSAPPAAEPVAAADPAAPAPQAVEDLHFIKSPIVGTFYAAPGPGTPSFVKVGDQVQNGQVVCIIEAMKLMNEIEADVAGEVVRALVENGQPVEYGQSLFAIRPAKKK